MCTPSSDLDQSHWVGQVAAASSVMLCCAVLCCAVLCCAVLCRFMQSQAMLLLCHAMAGQAKPGQAWLAHSMQPSPQLCAPPLLCCPASTALPLQEKGHQDLAKVEADEEKVWGFEGDIQSVGQLVRVLTTIAFTASAHHASVNFGQVRCSDYLERVRGGLSGRSTA